MAASSAELLQLADAVTAALNQVAVDATGTTPGTFLQQVAAVRLYTPDFALQEMETLHVSVVPRGLVIEWQDRTSHKTTYEIDVGVEQRAQSGWTQAQVDTLCDGLMRLVEQIGDLLAKTVLQTADKRMRPVVTENAPCYDPDALRDDRLFRSVVTQGYVTQR